MIRGTTPTLKFNIGKNILLKEMAEIWLTIKGFEKEITIKLTDGDRFEIDEDDNTLEVTLTQEETLGFTTVEVKMQLRFLDNNGNAYASNIQRIAVENLIKDGVIA